MRLVTANIRNNPDMARQLVREDARTVAGLGSAVLFQEIGEREDHEDVAVGLGKGWDVYFTKLPIPIALRSRRFKLVSQDEMPDDELQASGYVRTHRGRRGASPSRYISWVVVTHPSRSDDLPIVIMNTHFVSGAWNWKPKLWKRWRKRMWKKHWKKMQKLIQAFHDAGYTVIFGGDFNRTHVEKFHPKHVWLSNRGIDKIGAVPAPSGAQVRLRLAKRVELNSDHDARVASFALSA